ncbi:hypothetical protein IT413_06210 [Candidatus Peregrinibacteria bacterium]|nr:hypothetical protein [Candidatus Peregrinibacteria bacterium]
MNLQDLPVLPPQSLPECIRSTLCFFDLFDYPLTFDELRYYLLCTKHYSDEEIFEALKKCSSVVFRDGFYCLVGSEGHVNSRKVRAVIAGEYNKKLRRFLPFIRLVPFVKMVAVCNTLAIGCPTAKSDIDLFIISKKDRIFIVRTLTAILFHILGVRRHGEKVAGRFCLSFFISEEKMNLQDLLKGKDDIYFMYWFRTLRPLYGLEVFQKLLQSNEWAKTYFAQSLEDNRKQDIRFSQRAGVFRFFAFLWEFLLGGFLGKMLENALSRSHMKRHVKRSASLQGESSVVVSSGMLKYHNVDRREEYRLRFFDKFLKS